jgi:hypothetical protein
MPAGVNDTFLHGVAALMISSYSHVTPSAGGNTAVPPSLASAAKADFSAVFNRAGRAYMPARSDFVGRWADNGCQHSWSRQNPCIKGTIVAFFYVKYVKTDRKLYAVYRRNHSHPNPANRDSMRNFHQSHPICAIKLQHDRQSDSSTYPPKLSVEKARRHEAADLDAGFYPSHCEALLLNLPAQIAAPTSPAPASQRDRASAGCSGSLRRSL